ncbi:RNA-directed DNA polymerase [Mesorhizobium sp. VK9D]|uniref:RNA-directed DNA polymerase n=1 Tax=Mesorhizobium australafricanum TaxID=3072311 RepID=UPI002A24B1F7|nr:RNA-directed DNA polymerase [Mesorhizobium sp. VK9D]MDX8453926.1 RNA-directed DNA polymerase [Mesorhizobium sp. VK9D]
MLPEMKCFAESADAIVADCAKLNLGQYTPTGVVENLTPKSWLGFRIAHQLTAADNLIYLAALLDCADRLEASRTPEERNEAFAYRFDTEETKRVFKAGRGFHQWISYLVEFGASDRPFLDPPVITTDIADFYQRIYFHRIENILDDAGAPRGPSELIKKIIKTTRARQSYGLPVGTTASRLIAECVLNDTDTFLRNLGVTFTRFVDDFRIIASDEQSAHSILCKLAEHLMVTEGLSLNVSKTKIGQRSELEAGARHRLQDVFSSSEMESMASFIQLNYGEGDDESEDDSLSNPFIAFMKPSVLFEKMDSLGDKRGVDLSIFKAILRVLRFIPVHDPVYLLGRHAELLYYIPREFCMVLTAWSKQDGFPHGDVKTRVLELLHASPYADLPYVRSWLIALFVNGTLPYEPSDWATYDFNRTIMEKRARIFLKGLANDRPYFRAQRTQLGGLSEWEKPAALMAAMCLPADEYSAWLDVSVSQLASPFARTYCNWLKRSHGSLRAILEQ